MQTSNDLCFLKPSLVSSVSPWSHSQDPIIEAAGANGSNNYDDYGFHTSEEQSPWWMVDLVETYHFNRIEITNRTQESQRFKNFVVETSLDSNIWRIIHTQIKGTRVSSDTLNPYIISLDDAVFSRFIRIRMLGIGYLHLRRVRVYSVESKSMNAPIEDQFSALSSANQIIYNSSIREELTTLLNFEYLWDAKPHEAVAFSYNFNAPLNAIFDLRNVTELSKVEYLKLLISAMPNTAQKQKIIDFSKHFFAELKQRREVADLVQLTNYVFKSLSLGFNSNDQTIVSSVLEIMHELHYYANLQIHEIQSQKEEYYEFPTRLDEALKNLSRSEEEENIVFTFLTANYEQNFRLWHKLYKSHNRGNNKLFVLKIGIGFSSEFEDYLSKESLKDTIVFHFLTDTKIGVCGDGISLSFLWYLKIHVSAWLVEKGWRVTYSDLDAYWIKNYFDLFDQLRKTFDADIILSSTGDMPKSVVDKWGFTPCAGFFSVEPTTGGRAFMTEWRQMTEIMFDDQIALAQVLLQNGAEWKTVPTGSDIKAKAQVFPSSIEANIIVMSDDVARRVGTADPKTIGGTTIWHPRWAVAPEAHDAFVQSFTVSQLGSGVIL
ncbi:discoidin domain-containing protein [Acidocella facilis]|uniref:discoidin domain-containing protein n=1 Tax=Acidocella facilis TaxID=525 RepID=UPI001F195FE1|nr:discoidin domain-containing protein [Acidocella facilis]